MKETEMLYIHVIMYIYREILNKLTSLFDNKLPKGLILSGIVGCGKTTVIEKLLSELSQNYAVFRFTGDDAHFRSKVIGDSKYILDQVQSQTNRRAFVFVDEVQKSEEVFDAIKIAFDSGRISFIVSGSNPAYLSTVAKKRLQRRADQMFMLPISLSELSIQNHWATQDDCQEFQKILWEAKTLDDIKVPALSVPEKMRSFIDEYLVFGGLPLALLEKTTENKLREIRLTVERGFDLLSKQNNALSDITRIELANLHSQEFSYKNILERTRTRQRDAINQVIDDLINHGYMVKKKPSLLTKGKTSYLSVFSYIDPGIVSYLSSERDLAAVRGSRVEGYIHARLSSFVYNSVYKSELSYFKPHDLDINKNVRYQAGEVDFVLQTGRRLLPIEAKASTQMSEIDSSMIKDFIRKKGAAFGVILYGGAPYLNFKEKIIYWPYWMV